MASRDVHVAVGFLVGCALEQEWVRRVSSVFYDQKRTVVVLEHADAAYSDVHVAFKRKEVADLNFQELEDWADDLVTRAAEDDGEAGAEG